jgi:hypothetical protein
MIYTLHLSNGGKIPVNELELKKFKENISSNFIELTGGIINPSFVAVVFDTAGNAFATSQTALDRLDPGVARTIAFTWPSGWKYVVGRIDILPVSVPTPVTKW